MSERLKNCWEILNCGREKGGSKVIELGECIAAKEGLGHSCWAIAGTLCGGAVQGTEAQKKPTCMMCGVYKLYHRISASKGNRIKHEFPREHEKHTARLRNRMRNK